MSTNVFAPSFNPFIANAAPAIIEEDTLVDFDGAEASYALVKSGPEVSADEVESAYVDAVEIKVRWGTQVLSISHLDGGKSFFVGEGSDIALPEETLGASRAAIVLARDGGTYVVVPAGAHANVTQKNVAPASFVGPQEIALGDAMNVVLEIGSLTLEIATVRKGKVAPASFLASLAGGATGMVGLSFLGHAAIVASLAMFMPKMTGDDADAASRDQMMLMQKYLSAAAEREPEQLPKDAADDASQGGGSTGERHKGPEGISGVDKPVTTKGRIAVKGDNRDAALSRQEEIQQARDFGMIGILGSGALVDPNAPKSPWGEEPHGNQDKNAHGLMFAPTIDDALGFGFGMSGTGEGGGGDGKGVGLDHVSTVGNGGGDPNGKWGMGKCTDPNGKCDGMGIGHGPGNGGHIAKPPIVREITTTSNGRLPAEVIQRIVRQNFGRFRLCYEAGLRSNPGLQGRVATQFVIGRDGSVNVARDAGSDLPDQQVVQCIVRSFTSLSFPAPDGGVATVTYPIILQPGES
jgi:hypothetical protein